jgi:hypothetical protein
MSETKTELKVFKLDHHIAIKTNARTYWLVNGVHLDIAIDKGLVKLLYSTYTLEKTHFDVFVMPMQPNLTFTRIRVSNRGNKNVQKFDMEQMEKLFSASQDDIEFLRAEGKL